MSYCDLHLHSTCSDGSDTPETVVARAVAAGIGALALTDHDTLAGVHPAKAAAEAAGLGFLHGVEISADFEGMEVHVLAYGIDLDSSPLNEALERLRQGRAQRGIEILDKLREIDVTLPKPVEESLRNTPNLGRMHIAQALRDAGHVAILQEAFDRFLNPGKPAFVTKLTLPLDAALDLIHGSGGLAILAHPGLYRQVLRRLPDLLLLPFDGLEVWHTSHSPERVKRFQSEAKQRGLLPSGGSDCHGDIKGRREMGRVRTPMHVYERIHARLADR